MAWPKGKSRKPTGETDMTKAPLTASHSDDKPASANPVPAAPLSASHSQAQGAMMADKKKTLDDFTAEMNAAKVQEEGPNPAIATNMQAEADVPNKKAVKMPAISQATREQMLAELAKKFSTTPEEIAERLKVGDPVNLEPSPDNVIKELPAGTVLIPLILKRDYWAHEYAKAQWPSSGNNRFPEGSKISLPGKEARRLIASGAAVRNDPLPDEDSF